jgi:hypothetical protein
MTIFTNRITLNQTRQEIVSARNQSQRVCIHNDTGGRVYLGNESVTVDNGIHLDANDERNITLNPNESLWGISSASREVSVMIQIME